MWNTCVIYELYLYSWLRLYFKDCGGPLCKEPTLPPLPRIFLVLFPCISLSFTKKEYAVLPSLPLNLNGCNPHVLSLCFGEKTQTLKGELYVSFLWLLMRAVFWLIKNRGGAKCCFIRRKQQKQVSWGLPSSVAVAEKEDLDKSCAEVRAFSKPESY